MFIYVLKDVGTGLCKVGYSKNPYKRLKTLTAQRKTSSGKNDLLVMLNTIKADDARELERDIHDFLHKYRVSGEWFRPESVGFLLDVDIREPVPRKNSLLKRSSLWEKYFFEDEAAEVFFFDIPRLWG